MLERGRKVEGDGVRVRGWGWVGGGNLSLLQSESPGSTANDQSTASHWNKKSGKINKMHKKKNAIHKSITV